MVELFPRSRVKGWAKVRFLTPAEARSSSLITVWEAPVSARPVARLLASPWENVEAVSTHGPPPGFRPALRSTVVAPVDLRLDLPRDPGFGEGGHVDGHVGLVDHLVARRAQPPGPAHALSPRDRVASIWLTASGLTASVVATSRWSVSASAIGLKLLVVTGTITPTRRGPVSPTAAGC